ncbi:DNA glycosylase, partial [Ramicandelaber brevisporus]
LPDVISSDLDVLFLGINPGVESARRGHHFAGRTNYFWHGLHASGLTVQKLPPDHDALLPQAHSSISAYRMGLTNLCPRITKTSAELSGKELADGVPNAVAKIVKYTPKIVCFVGKTAWDVFNNHCGRPSDSLESANGGKGKDKRRAKQPKPASYLGFQTYRRCTIVKANSSKGSSDEDEDEEVNKVTHFFVMPSTSGRTFGFSRDEKLAYFKQLK